MTEDLKSQLDYFKDEPKYLRKVIDELEQENKEIKEENVKLLFGKGALIKLCDNLTKIIDEKKEKESKLWQALEEIREIAEKYKDMEGCRIPLGAIKMTVDKVLNLS